MTTDQAAIDAEIEVQALRRQVQRLTYTLSIIAKRGGANRCEHTHDSSPDTCRSENSGRTRTARYLAEEWCSPCVAQDRLDAEAQGVERAQPGRQGLTPDEVRAYGPGHWWEAQEMVQLVTARGSGFGSFVTCRACGGAVIPGDHGERRPMRHIQWHLARGEQPADWVDPR